MALSYAISQQNSRRHGGVLCEEVHTIFETLFTGPGALRHHREEPFAAERAAYLQAVADQGIAQGTVLRRSSYCLCVAVELQRRPAGHYFKAAGRTACAMPAPGRVRTQLQGSRLRILENVS
mgnify:CR=1 FL=1